ncbi:MAG: hypothetical protein SFY92_12680 [Verrucomicrobiae bacterium]|nr:hypothetical protein [Verrucomicrobiae bacterium]
MKKSPKNLLLMATFVAVTAGLPVLMAEESPKTTPKEGPACKIDPAKKAEMKAKREQFQKEMGLTEDQMSQLKTLRNSRKEEMKALKEDKSLAKEDKKAKFEALRAKYDGQMKQILTPEQFAKFEAKRAEHMKKRKDQYNQKKNASASTPPNS